MSTQDKVQLSERERQQLAGIKAMLESGDPRLARVLTGEKRRFHAAVQVVAGVVRSCARTGSEHVWVGPLVALVGFALVLGALALSLSWLGVLAELVAGVGVAFCFVAAQRHRAAGGAERQVGAPVSH
ncbi:MAG: hypothetical protein ABSA91_03720 [Acidimicrobiales bacterium]|jgi:ABC-type phosphate/phosphonate transport system permease subunit